MSTENIVLLHGWGGSKKSLKSLGKKLEDFNYKVHILEMPGHGETPEMNTPWTMNDFSNWLSKHLTENSLQNPILIGHSFGGRIIIDTLIKKKADPSKVVLIDASGIKPKNSVKRFFWKRISNLSKKVLNENKAYSRTIRKIAYKTLIRESDYVKLNSNMRKTFENINNEFYNDLVWKIKTKTLIIWGNKDKTTPLWMGIFLNKKIKNSRLEVLNGSHSLPLKHPEEVAKLINDFLKQ